MGARFSPPVQTSPEAHPASYTNTAVLSRDKASWGVVLTAYPFLAPGLNVCTSTFSFLYVSGGRVTGQPVPLKAVKYLYKLLVPVLNNWNGKINYNNKVPDCVHCFVLLQTSAF
jgi:hypothetical protein